MFEPGDRFMDCWPEIWKVISPDYHEMLAKTPTRIEQREKEIKEKQDEKKKNKNKEKNKDDKDKEQEHSDENPVQRKIKAVVDEFDKEGRTEARGKYMNLAYTKPAENTTLQEDLTFGSVENELLDMFMDVAAVGRVDVAASAGDGDDLDVSGIPIVSSEAVRAPHRYPWKIPAGVEKGLEIPIAVTSKATMPQPGEFKRLALDIVVNAVWLGVYFARLEGNDEALSSIKALILDWPMDFIFFEGHTPEIIEEKSSNGRSTCPPELKNFGNIAALST